MSTAHKPVKKLSDDKIRADRKRQADQKKLEDKNAASTVKQEAQTVQAHKRRIVVGESLLLGNDQLDKAPAISTINGDDEYKKFLESKDVFQHPFMLTGSATVTEVLSNTDGASKWMSLWHLCGILLGTRSLGAVVMSLLQTCMHYLTTCLFVSLASRNTARVS